MFGLGEMSSMHVREVEGCRARLALEFDEGLRSSLFSEPSFAIFGGCESDNKVPRGFCGERRRDGRIFSAKETGASKRRGRGEEGEREQGRTRTLRRFLTVGRNEMMRLSDE